MNTARFHVLVWGAVTLLVPFAVTLGCLPPAPAGRILIENGDFEAGGGTPIAWTALPSYSTLHTFTWERPGNGGNGSCVAVESTSAEPGMWQQVVGVEPDRVYEVTGYAAVEDVSTTGGCNLQVVFRDQQDGVLETIDLPKHTGSRGFLFDFPARLKVRAPNTAYSAEINLVLHGPGKAWFDDVCFRPAATGTLRGTVTSGNEALPGVQVKVLGDPWGREYLAVTDARGRYEIRDLPVAFPRYVLYASKEGYRSQPAGRVAVFASKTARYDFDLVPGTDPDNLRIVFGYLYLSKWTSGTYAPVGATIPDTAEGYPESIRAYLEGDGFVDPANPDTMALANSLVENLPPESRRDTRAVVWAMYDWFVKNIDHDVLFLQPPNGYNVPYRDCTTGMWQLASGDGWGWGKSFYDWCYTPTQLLQTRTGICIEGARLTCSVLRFLNIPCRADSGRVEFFAQTDAEHGNWVTMKFTNGRVSYRDYGILGSGFEGEQPLPRFSVTTLPLVPVDWDSDSEWLWWHQHPPFKTYPATNEGYAEAVADLGVAAATGEIRRGPVQAEGLDMYTVQYEDVTFNLSNVGNQRDLDVRCPLVADSDIQTFTGDVVVWTNHPECLKGTWTESITNAPVEGTEPWYHMDFDLTPLVE